VLDRDVPNGIGQDGAGDGKERGRPVFQRQQGKRFGDKGPVDEKDQRQAADGQADKIKGNG
jgi:hypothetical protein